MMESIGKSFNLKRIYSKFDRNRFRTSFLKQYLFTQYAEVLANCPLNTGLNIFSLLIVAGLPHVMSPHPSKLSVHLLLPPTTLVWSRPGSGPAVQGCVRYTSNLLLLTFHYKTVLSAAKYTRGFMLGLILGSTPVCGVTRMNSTKISLKTL